MVFSSPFPYRQLPLINDTDPRSGPQIPLASSCPRGPLRMLLLPPRMSLIQLSAHMTASWRGLPRPKPPSRTAAAIPSPFSSLPFVSGYFLAVDDVRQGAHPSAPPAWGLVSDALWPMERVGEWPAPVSRLCLKMQCAFLLTPFESF